MVYFHFQGYYFSYYVQQKSSFHNTLGNYENINLNILLAKKYKETLDKYKKIAKNDHELLIYNMII